MKIEIRGARIIDPASGVMKDFVYGYASSVVPNLWS